MRAKGLKQIGQICAETKAAYPQLFSEMLSKLEDLWELEWDYHAKKFSNQPQFRIAEHVAAKCLNAQRSATSLHDVLHNKYSFEIKCYNKFRSLSQINGSVPITNDKSRFYIIIEGEDKSKPKFWIFSSVAAYKRFIPRIARKKRIKDEISNLNLENEILRRLSGCKKQKPKDQKMSFNISDPSGKTINIRFDIKFSCR